MATHLSKGGVKGPAEDGLLSKKCIFTVSSCGDGRLVKRAPERGKVQRRT